MQLSARQLAEFDRDGFVILPGLLSRDEVDALVAECDRLSSVEAEYIKRERSGALRTIFRVHEDDGPTRSPEFRALARSPRLVVPATQILNDAALFIFHTKINLKPALEGTIWAWHQDYGTWQHDGLPTSNIVTALVMLDDADEIGGALYLVPGSHKLGTIPHVEDKALGALNQYSVPRGPLLKALDAARPVAVTGRAGTVALFHSNVIHGSGHNMSSRDRRQLYIVYTPVANKPLPVPSPRPDHVRSTNWAPIEIGADSGILDAARRGHASATATTAAETRATAAHAR